MTNSDNVNIKNVEMITGAEAFREKTYMEAVAGSVSKKRGTDIPDQISKLRYFMSENNIDIYYIPTDDFHGSEFVSDFFKAREYMSGFTGSAGTLIVTRDMAGLFTDGRYFLQAENELKGTGIELFRVGNKGVPTINEFLNEKLLSGMTLGFDGRCVTAKDAISMQEYFEENGKEILFRCDTDLVDYIWTDRPKLPDARTFILDEQYCGETIQSKMARVLETIRKKRAGGLVLTSLDDIAWLLNIRGGDIKCSPLVLSYMIITLDDITFYCGTGNKSDAKLCEIYDYLSDNGITIKGYFDIYNDIRKLENAMPVIADSDKVNYRIYDALNKLPDSKILDIINPTTEFKAIKNSTEVKNQKQAHIKDAVAYVRFLYWFKNDCLKHKNQIHVTELDLADRLLSERKKMEGFVDESFEPIVAYGSHGAIVHYSPSQESNIPIGGKSFVLIDTGGHYLEGTTDITRTIVCGELSEEEREHYTLVLKGNLALGSAVFLEETTGAGLDMLARKPLWDRYLDYKHGTGHGVGYLLNVHEGPNGIRYRVGSGKNISVAMKPGMITSNEPGLYIEGKYGIRLENMIVCKEETENEFGRFLSFETLTLVPFDLDAIKTEMLDEKEINLINSYHERIFLTISPYVNDEEREFLRAVTRKIEYQAER